MALTLVQLAIVIVMVEALVAVAVIVALVQLAIVLVIVVGIVITYKVVVGRVHVLYKVNDGTNCVLVESVA